MLVGVDGRKIPFARERGPLGTLDHAHEIGMDGVFFRTVLDMSPTLDVGELKGIRERADELGLYLESGLGLVNPFATPETPELRRVGDGDIRAGFERMMKACAEIDCRELWVSTAGYKGEFDGYFAYDRFRTDVSWKNQLAATENFLTMLRPAARDLGVHLNIETHEDITSFEVVRLVEAVGPDVLGIVFDTGNVLQRAECPVAAARRVAPYTRQTHIKDAILAFAPGGVVAQARTCGDGAIDFAEILSILAVHRPDLTLSIENPTGVYGHHVIQVFDTVWLGAHPDLTVAEMASYFEIVTKCEERIQGGQADSPAAYVGRPFDDHDALIYIKDSAAYLRHLLVQQEDGRVAG